MAGTADDSGMRSRSVVTALVTLTAGLAASAVARHLSTRRLRRVQAAPAVTEAASTPVADPAPAVVVAPAPDAVVLPFSRRVPLPAEQRPAAPARCGDSGGRTKAGSPCGARGTVAGRCHHHRLAA